MLFRIFVIIATLILISGCSETPTNVDLRETESQAAQSMIAANAEMQSALMGSGSSFIPECPCDGFRNHGQFMKCVANEAESLFVAGILTEEQKDCVVSKGGEGRCGKGPADPPDYSACFAGIHFCLNGRDFDGLITEGSNNHWDGFTWVDWSFSVEIENYGSAEAVWAAVRQSDNFPLISIVAGVPPTTYRAWINQIDEGSNWTLETTIEGTSVTTGGTTGGWKEIGTHNVYPDTVITVQAVGPFGYYGQPFPQRRGGFHTIYLTTDLGSTPPGFVPDGQTCPS